MLQAVHKLERLGPDQFELFFQRKTSTKIQSKNQKTDSLSRAEDVGLAIRVIKNKRLGFSFTTSLDTDSVARAAEAACEIAELMPVDEFLGFHTFRSSVYPAVDTFDARGWAAPLKRKIELALQLEASAREADPRIKGVRSAQVAENLVETQLVDSSGDSIQHQSTIYSASITCKAEDGGDSQVGHDFGFAHDLDGLDIAAVGKQAASYATELLQAGAAPTMKCPAILRNSVVAELIEFLSSSFSAEEIDKGRSLLAGKHGQRVFSDRITLIDDALLADGYGTSPFDGEGIPSRRNTLVDGGLMTGALYDLYYARKFDKEPTGSAVRGIKSPPSVGFSNLYLKPGSTPLTELTSKISSGILITDLMGVHTANPVTGDFSVGASGILVENGILTRPVRGFAVAGNILDLFRKMTEIGSDLRFFGSTGAPSVLISELSVGGA